MVGAAMYADYATFQTGLASVLTLRYETLAAYTMSYATDGRILMSLGLVSATLMHTPQRP